MVQPTERSSLSEFNRTGVPSKPSGALLKDNWAFEAPKSLGIFVESSLGVGWINSCGSACATSISSGIRVGDSESIESKERCSPPSTQRLANRPTTTIPTMLTEVKNFHPGSPLGFITGGSCAG